MRRPPALLLIAALAAPLAAARPPGKRPRPAPLDPSPAALAARPMDAIDRERELISGDAQDIERRLRSVAQTEARREQALRARVRTLYKISQGGFARLALGAEAPEPHYEQRNAALRLLRDDLDEVRALRAEVERLRAEQQALGGPLSRLAQLDEVRRQVLAEAGGARTLAGLGRLRGALPRPVVPGTVVTRFGSEPLAPGLEVFRHGVRLAAEPRAPVRAVAAGVVRYAGEAPGDGQVVILAHDGGYLTLYGRLGEVLVAQGSAVPPGAALGRAGGDEISFYLALDNVTLDPAPWFE